MSNESNEPERQWYQLTEIFVDEISNFHIGSFVVGRTDVHLHIFEGERQEMHLGEFHYVVNDDAVVVTAVILKAEYKEKEIRVR